MDFDAVGPRGLDKVLHITRLRVEAERPCLYGGASSKQDNYWNFIQQEKFRKASK